MDMDGFQIKRIRHRTQARKVVFSSGGCAWTYDNEDSGRIAALSFDAALSRIFPKMRTDGRSRSGPCGRAYTAKSFTIFLLARIFPQMKYTAGRYTARMSYGIDTCSDVK